MPRLLLHLAPTPHRPLWSSLDAVLAADAGAALALDRWGASIGAWPVAAKQHAEAVRLEEAQRVARLAAALPAFADPVGMEGWTYHAGQRRWHREARVAGSHRVTTMVILLTDSADVGWEIKDGPEDAPRLRTALAWGVVDTRAEAIAALLREAR